MLKFKRTLLAVAIAGLYGASAAADSEMKGVTKASDLMGKTVTDSQGQELGEIEDFALDVQEGKLAYVVLSTGSLLDKKLVGISTDDLQPATEGDGFMADISQQDLENAEGLPEDNWPEQAPMMAGGSSSSGMQSFSSLDEDGDGYVSQSEADQASDQLSQNFDQIDENADDQIDRSEFSAFEAEHGQMKDHQQH